MTANLLSLPSTIFTNIWNFCGANEIVALASTCRIFNTEIESSMLVMDAARDCVDPMEMTLFFPEHCHSVFLTCNAGTCYCRQDHTIIILSRQRQQTGDYDTVVWQKTKRCQHEYSLTFDISFRTDPSQEYLLLHVCHESGNQRCHVNVRKQFMTRAMTPAMRGALSHCLDMGGFRYNFWKPLEWNGHKEFDMLEPIKQDDNTICLIQQQILNLLEQALEQKEPIECVKRSLSPEELERNAARPERTARQIHSSHKLRLTKEFYWNRAKGRRLDLEEDIRFHDELIFVARIPLAPNTAHIEIRVGLGTVAPKSTFVIFFQKRQNDINDLEKPIIGGKVFTHERLFSTRDNLVRVNVKPEYEACFLYFLPNDETEMRLELIDVILGITVVGRYNSDLALWTILLLHGFEEWVDSHYHHLWPFVLRHNLWPFVLLRACALALLGPEKEQYTAFKEAFDMQRLDSTPEGLECIVDVCNTLLKELSSLRQIGDALLY